MKKGSTIRQKPYNKQRRINERETGAEKLRERVQRGGTEDTINNLLGTVPAEVRVEYRNNLSSFKPSVKARYVERQRRVERLRAKEEFKKKNDGLS